MAERLKIMADGSQSPEINPNEPNVVISPEAGRPAGSRGILDRLLKRAPQAQVLVKPGEHSRTPEEIQRLEAARQVLAQTALTEAQKEKGFDEEAILRAHYEAAGEKGKDGRDAGIGNYKVGQLLRKAEILKDSFTPEQRRALMENKIVGIISRNEYAHLNLLIDPNLINDPKLKQIASVVAAIGNTGRLNDQSLGTYAEKVLDLLTEGADEAEAIQLIGAIEGLRSYAILPPEQREITSQASPSQYENIKKAISQLESQPPSLSRDAALEDAIRERDYLYEEARELGLFMDAKAELSGLFYSSRVGVTNDEKEGKQVFQGRGKIRQLEDVQRANRSWEWRSDFWSRLNVPLDIKFRGMIDDFYQGSIERIVEVVRDRKRYTEPQDQYPEAFTPINKAWEGPVFDSAGHSLKDEQGMDIIVNNFDEVRAVIEEARRQEPWVANPNRDYETYIRLVADDPEEFEEMVPYIVRRVIDKLGAGQPNTLSNTLESEKGKIEGALIYIPKNSERQFRRMKSIMSDAFNLMGAFYFSEPEKVNGDWSPYLSYMDLLAAASRDTEERDHLVDSSFLDKDGLIMFAISKFLEDDGIFWRYGQNSASLGKKVENYDMAPLHRWQNRRREKITTDLMTRKLRRMQDLLNMDENGVPLGDPNHPAFQRLKADYDRLDQEDIMAHNSILDADGNPANETRWEEYCKKALEWQNTRKMGDPRAADRVIFQHPLARSFKLPTRNAQGQVYYEFWDMFEEDKRVTENKPEDRWYREAKLRKIRSLVGDDQTEGQAGRIARAFMLDSMSALAWHTVREINPDAQGAALVAEQARVVRELAEINKYLQGADMDPITADQAVPQKTLYRAIMRALIKEDEGKDPKNKNFKFFYLLTQKLGLALDVPTFAAWYLGSHDSLRPSVIAGAIAKDNQPGGLAAVWPEQGMDEKNSGASWSERERRLALLVIMVMKGKFGGTGRFFNFPGHDTRGAGVKDVRNYLNLQYGVSADTVWLNDLRDALLPLEQDFPRDYGFTQDPITQLVGAYKGGNEAIFRQSGFTGLIESPRDFRGWVKRTRDSTERQKVLTSGDKEGYALLKDGPFTNMFLWRDFSWGDMKSKMHAEKDPDYMISHPTLIIEEMHGLHEPLKRAAIELGGRTIGPLIKVMKESIDSTFGPNPGSARFANTLLWYAVSKWMDTSREYRFYSKKTGSGLSYAIDGNLAIARTFMHTALLEHGENGLIYNDQEFDEIMLGYIVTPDKKRIVRYEVDAQKRVKVETKGHDGRIHEEWVSGEIHEGLIDAFPQDLRKEILEGTDRPVTDENGEPIKDRQGRTITYKDYLLPFGVNSNYPETFANYYRENHETQEMYAGALSQIRPRRKVTRP